MKTVYIIHGWSGSPNEAIHKWLKSELIKRGYEVIVPEMPDTDQPKIKAWVDKLNEIIKNPNKDTILVGHSIGCQTILRYLEKLDTPAIFGGVIFIAPFLTLKNLETEEEKVIAKPWLETPIDSISVIKHAPKMISIFSDNDPDVSLDNKEVFEQKFNSKTIIEHEKGHFTEESNVTEVPSALDAILKL